MSEHIQEPFRHPSSADSLNWDDSTTFRHVNGVTVYEQQEPDSKEATYMVSASVHATPEDCHNVSISLTLAHASQLTTCFAHQTASQCLAAHHCSDQIDTALICWACLLSKCLSSNCKRSSKSMTHQGCFAFACSHCLQCSDVVPFQPEAASEESIAPAGCAGHHRRCCV